MISVVMPSHNTLGREENFRRTLEEIQAEDVHLILVLDRVDAYPKSKILQILSEFPKLNYELVVGNYGNPGAARNAGLKIVKSEWVAFWDFDDVPNFKAVKRNLSIVNTLGYDAIAGGYTSVNRNRSDLAVENHLGSSYLRKIASNPGIWRFIFSTNSIKGLNFPEISMGEDQVFIGLFFGNHPRILVSDEIMYNYYVGDPRQTTKQKALLRDLMTSSHLLLRVVREKNTQNKALIAKLVVRQLKTGILRGDLHLKIKSIKKLFQNWWIIPLSMQSMKEAKVLLHLTGGLGNQLFQYAAGLSESKGRGLLIQSTFGNPRTAKNGKPELFTFNLMNSWAAPILKFKPLLVSKVLGYNLKVGIKPSVLERKKLTLFTIRVLSNLFLSVFFKTTIQVNPANGVGFSRLKMGTKRTNYLIGYFQSYRWAENPEVLRVLKQLQPLDMNPSIKNWKAISEEEHPLVVHFRLGDYKLEKSFGNLNQTYYEAAINQAWNTGAYKRIWIFSDEIELAKQIFDIEILRSARWIDTSEETSANVLEIMRMGYGYVIANSTFSWWGAFLSHSKNPDVIAPMPWFKDEAEPIDLIPLAWKRMNAIWN